VRERRLGDVSPASLRRPDSLATATAARLDSVQAHAYRGMLWRISPGRSRAAPHRPASFSRVSLSRHLGRKQSTVAEVEEAGVPAGMSTPRRIRLTFALRVSPGRRPRRIPALRSNREPPPRQPSGAVRGRHCPARSRDFCGQYAQRARRHARDRRDTVPDRSGAVRAALHCQLLLKAANACSSVSPTDDISDSTHHYNAVFVAVSSSANLAFFDKGCRGPPHS